MIMQLFIEFNYSSWAQRSPTSVSVEDASSFKSSPEDTCWFPSTNFLAVLNSGTVLPPCHVGWWQQWWVWTWKVSSRGWETPPWISSFSQVSGISQRARFSVKREMFQFMICLFVTLWPVQVIHKNPKASELSCVKWKGWISPLDFKQW